MAIDIPGYTQLAEEEWWAGMLLTRVSQDHIERIVGSISDAMNMRLAGYFEEGRQRNVYHLTRTRGREDDVMESKEKLANALWDIRLNAGGIVYLENLRKVPHIRVLLGLVEGYVSESTVRVHELPTVVHALPSDVTVSPVKIIAKRVDRPLYTEPAAILDGKPEHLQAIGELAREINQTRFTVEDVCNGTTVTYQRSEGG